MFIKLGFESNALLHNENNNISNKLIFFDNKAITFFKII